MMIFECKYCGDGGFFLKEVGTQVGLHCAKCGKWHKWLGKSELAACRNALENAPAPVVTQLTVLGVIAERQQKYEEQKKPMQSEESRSRSDAAWWALEDLKETIEQNGITAV